MAGSHRPGEGWLRALRDSQGLSLQAVADRLGVSPQAVHQFEKSEVAGTISLRQLANVAAAMGGRVTYEVLAPARAGTDPTGMKNTAHRNRSQPESTHESAAARPVLERSLLLENQETGRFD